MTVDASFASNPILEMKPTDPRPTIVEVNSVVSIKLLTYSWSPWVVDTKDSVETYPEVPRPVTVDASFASRPIVEINPRDPRPTIVEVNSVVSIKLLTYSWSPWVVDTKDSVET